MIDSNLSWKYHTELICYKVSRSLGIIAKIRHYIPRRLLLQMCNSLIVPYLTYGICAWGNCSNNYREKILLLLKTAFRLIYFGKSKELAVPFFLKSNCPPLPSLFFQECSYLVWINRQCAPINTLNQFTKTSSIPNCNTRFSSNESFYGTFNFEDGNRGSRVGVKIWNSILPSIKLFSRTKYRKVIKSLLEDLLQSEDDYAEVPRLIELFSSLSSLPS